MLAIRLRVRPWRARCSPRSLGRSTVSVPSAWETFISRLTAWVSSPFGPLTATRPGFTSTVTPSGIAIGFLPIRLIGSAPPQAARSPHVGDDLAADAALTRLVAGHHPHRGAQNRGPHPAHHPRDLLVRDVAPPSRARDPPQPADHRPPLARVLERDSDDLPHGRGLDVEPVDVALLLEDPRDLLLQPGGGHLDVDMLGVDRVADPGQVVGDGIGQHHQLDLVIPGM